MADSTSPSSLQPHPILGSVIEICTATPNLKSTIEELKSFGIGPWKIHTFNTQTNISNGTINKQPASFRLRVGFAHLSKDVVYEVIQPLGADTDDKLDIFSSWLKARNGHAGIHHVAFDCKDVGWEERMRIFENMGAEFVQGGTWHGKQGTCKFAWFRKKKEGGGVEDQDMGTTSTFFETILFSDNWEDPEPDETC